MFKVSFRNQLILSPNYTGHKFVLTSPFIIYIGKKDGHFNVEIPSGFYTDFASIPKIFQNILSPLDNHIRAAVLHDYLYFIQKIGIYDITRKHADMIFLDAMKTCGTGKIKRQTMYYAVRAFGWVAWNKYKNDRIKNKEIK